MKIQTPALENSLACLRHPLTLLSIAVLLVNDQVLKIYSPSWLTGKLSDFTGLFFFPFIVAVGLSLLLRKTNSANRFIGQIAFSIVAIWFFLLKTFPPANSFTSHIASQLIGSPSQFILDPTDLLALITMLPAWIIWDKPKSKLKPNFLAYVALSIGVFASIATSPPRQAVVENVTNLEYYMDGIIYAGDKIMRADNIYPIAKSIDGGLTWDQSYEVQSVEEKSRPIKQCGYINQSICYRVTVFKDLLESIDNGGTWTTVYLGRTISNDMVIFDWEGKEVVLVALGKEGVMRRELPDGKWEKIPVLDANK